MALALCVAYIALFTTICFRWRFFSFHGTPSYTSVIIYLSKVLAGFAVMAVYTWIYPVRTEADTWKYFDDAMVVRNLWWTNRELFWRFFLGYDLYGPEVEQVFGLLHGYTNPYSYGLTHDSPTIIRINVLLSLFTGGHYIAHIPIMSFISMCGLNFIYRTIPSKSLLAMMAVFFLPSVWFWSSGVLKEAPLMFALGLFFYVSWQLFVVRRFHWSFVPAFLGALTLLLFLKEYVLISFLPAWLFLLSLRIFGMNRMIIQFLGVHAFVFILLMFSSMLYSSGSLLYVIGKKRTDFYNTARMAGAGSTIELPPANSPVDAVIHFPEAFAVTYLRPGLLEIRNVFFGAHAVENTVYLFLMLMALFFFKKPSMQLRAWCLVAFSFAISLAFIIGNTVPVLGSVVRYRIPALPFLIAAVVMCIDFDKLSKKMPFLSGIARSK